MFCFCGVLLALYALNYSGTVTTGCLFEDALTIHRSLGLYRTVQVPSEISFQSRPVDDEMTIIP
jgi:hypothetical protein